MGVSLEKPFNKLLRPGGGSSAPGLFERSLRVKKLSYRAPDCTLALYTAPTATLGVSTPLNRLIIRKDAMHPEQ